MDILIAKNIGFCFGVKRAYTISLNVLENRKNLCQMLGYLVHNENVVDRLFSMGIEFISSVDQVKKDGTVIIRAHGEPDSVWENLKEMGVEIIDATCPLVKKAQNFAKSLHKDGYTVVIIGDEDHAEVNAINGAINHEGIIIKDDKDLYKIPLENEIGIIIQTTQDKERVFDFINLLQKRFNVFKVCDTLCNSVVDRQGEVQEIAQKTDIVLVIGSKKSANTQRLVEIVDKMGKPVYGIEDVSKIDEKWFDKIKSVGVISGTSAPGWIIDEVIKKLEDIKNENRNS